MTKRTHPIPMKVGTNDMPENAPAPLLTIGWDHIVGMRIEGGGEYNGHEEEPIHYPVTIANMVAETLANKIRGDIERTVKDEVMKTITTQINDQVAAAVAEALAKPIRKTNSWGETQGEPTSMTELIGTEVNRFITTRSNRDSYRSNNTPASFAELLEQTVNRKLADEFKKEVDAAKAQLTESIRAKAATVLAELALKG